MRARCKILLLFCGGTIVMVENEQGMLAPPTKELALKSLLSLEPKVEEIADFDLSFIANIDSSDMTSHLWDQIAQEIFRNYDDYDGFVITHGTDTMAYTANALSFALQDLGKPVVLTGAQIPGSYLETDARRNFVNAIKLALMDVGGIFVLFGEKVILGTRASKISHSKLEAFTSVNQSSFGKVGVKIELKENLYKRSLKKPKLEIGFDSQIAVCSLVPGMPLDLLEKMIDQHIHGLILIAYGTGNIPRHYISLIEKMQKLKIPIVIRTQCLEGSTRMATYETGREALLFNAIEAYDMSLECTIVKLMWILKHESDYIKIKSLMHQNFVGEISYTGSS